MGIWAASSLLFSRIKPIWFTQHTTSAKSFPGPHILWRFGTVFIIKSRFLFGFTVVVIECCEVSCLGLVYLCMLPCVLNIIPLGFIPLLHSVYFLDLWFLQLLDFVAPGCFSQPLKAHFYFNPFCSRVCLWDFPPAFIITKIVERLWCVFVIGNPLIGNEHGFSWAKRPHRQFRQLWCHRNINQKQKHGEVTSNGSNVTDGHQVVTFKKTTTTKNQLESAQLSREMTTVCWTEAETNNKNKNVEAAEPAQSHRGNRVMVESFGCSWLWTDGFRSFCVSVRQASVTQ